MSKEMEEVSDLRAWKESAITQFGKAENLRKYLSAAGYLGWDIYEAALDLLKRDCPCCGYPNCGHEHPVK